MSHIRGKITPMRLSVDSIKKVWADLNRSIYVGNRLRSNMLALTFVSCVTSVLSFILIIINIHGRNTVMLIASVVTFLAGLACAFCSHRLKNREMAIKIPTVFCAVAFTLYVFTGAGEGTAILWSILVPIGISYFVSVRYGIILSAYYTVIYAIVFYTPLNRKISAYYSQGFMDRFPLLYASLSIFTCMAMIQYHRSVLFEIEHTDRLTEEVEKQTAVVKEQGHRIKQMSIETIQALANAIDAKDPYTKGHSSRVSRYSILIAEKLGWEKKRVEELGYAALLHDIGKIGVPDAILNNPRTLTDVEFDIIKTHTTVGRDILKEKTMIKMAEDVAGSHHERYDGTGYPQGLKGDEISEESRIVALADAFDAMNSDRVYRKKYDRDHVRSELVQGRKTQFDPVMADLFIKLWDDGVLDEIMKDNAPEEEFCDEASSVLLKEVVESFVTQSAKDEIDITTGIMTRTSGETAIAQAMKNDDGCLVFFDVDNLKKINDTYGHEAGDRILHLMGDTLTENGKGSLCCRLGGDEFLFFMKNVSEQEVKDRVGGIITFFEENKKDDPEISIASLSAGMVMCTSDDTYSDIYSKADKALYHVKQNGKSGYAFYNEESESVRNRKADVGKLVDSIKTSGSYKGAMNLEYREFAKLFEFISNLKQRFEYSFRLVMITLETDGEEDPGPDELERSMGNMEQSIRQTIRDVDVLTRYNSRQFLVILLGTEGEGIESAIGRIFRGYFKMNGSGPFKPTYSVAKDERSEGSE